MYTYKTHGVCSQAIMFDVVNNKVTGVKFIGGCMGNTTGVSKLCEGRDVDELINLLEGIKCRPTTSCPDQLAQALKKWKEENK